MATSSLRLPDGSITTSTSVAGPYDASQYNVASVVISGTYAGVNVTFEVSNDNVTYSSITASYAGSATVVNGATGVLTTNSTNAWDIAVGPFLYFRVRATAYTSGTAAVQVAGGFASYEPAVNAQIAAIVSPGSDGINALGTGNPDGSAAARPLASAPWGFNGATWDRLRIPTVFKSLNAVVITSETTIWTPGASKKFRLMGFCLAQGVATGAVTLKDNTAGSTILIIPPNTIGVTFVSPPMGNGILSAAQNNVLTATGASTETLTGYVFGTEE